MAGTQVNYVRRTITVDGVNQYEIAATCLVAGDLPDVSIFLLDIVQEDDPKNDALVRVAALQDFNAYLNDRNDAVDGGYATWRSSSVTLRYTDLETANAAASELSSRVNGLVTNNDTFLAEFETPTSGSVVTYPTVDTSVKEQLKTAARDAEAAIAPLEEDRDEVRVSCETLQAEVSVLQDRIAEAETDLSTVTSAIGEITPVYTALSAGQSASAAAVAQVRTYNNASGASTAEKADIEGQLAVLDTNMLVWATQNTTLNTINSSTLASLQSTLQTRLATLSAERNSKLVQLSQCNQSLAAAQGAVDNARSARDAALAAAVAVCPDFTI